MLEHVSVLHFFINECFPIVWLDHIVFIHSPADEHLG